MRLLIRKFLQKYGYDIVKLHPKYVPNQLESATILHENKWLQELNFATIIDIGANEGQFSERMRLLFPSAEIFAFEPLPDVYDTLVANFKTDANFKAFNVGIGATEGVSIFHKNESTASSSFMPMANSHKENFNFAIQTEPIELKIETLDAVFSQTTFSHPLLIKLDVQGFESEVIKGGSAILAQADIIISELSFYELYTNQPLFNTIYKQLQALGFMYVGSIEQLHSPLNNKVLQADGVFIKQKIKE